MDRQIVVSWATPSTHSEYSVGRYQVVFLDGLISKHVRYYVTFAGASLDMKDWMTYGFSPTEQEELEELAI